MIDWKYIEQTALSSFEEQMQRIPQPAKWHGEGDVLTHTRMVCESLAALPEYQSFTEQERHVISLAAMLHDIGKIVTTTIAADGECHSPHHAPTGSRMARRLLWTEYGLCGKPEFMQVREAVCLLIRYHSFPVHAIDMPNVRLRMHRIAANNRLSPLFSVRLLCLLSKADIIGRQSDERQESLDRIALCEELAREEGCYETCYAFPSAYTQRAYLAGREVWKDQQLYEDTWGGVILMSGLPGTGKDTWIRQNAADLPMVSLDAIRRKQRISPKAEQGYVANLAREQAKLYLRRHQPFVWNATDITPQMRESLVSLFETYHARVRIVWLETDWNTLADRNPQREDTVPMPVIDKMLDKTVPPEAYEAERVEWIGV